MTASPSDMSTDSAWEEWGRRDPYFGVITDAKYRSTEMTDQAKQEFFDSGRWHADHVIQCIRKRIDGDFAPKRILDFGCGVGRVLVPFAALADEVVGADVSSSMLLEAKRNCERFNVTNAALLQSDDTLSSLTGSFDLIHSCIVFQHIPVDRGRSIFTELLKHLSPGGVGAIQLTYSKMHFAATHGVPPHPVSSPTLITAPDNNFEQPPHVAVEPEIQMNPYNMNTLLFAMQVGGILSFFTEFTDHGGELGVFLFFQKPNGDP